MNLFGELKRRNVIKVGIAYAAATWILLQLTDVLSDILQLPEWAPKLILLILMVGFIPALILAWAFEMTPAGIKREKEVDRDQSITSQTGKKLNLLIIASISLALAYFVWESRFQVETRSDPVSQHTPVAEAEPAIARQSIAVLPFDNRSNREEDQFFTDGIHDDLLTTISRIGSMKVISRTSVMEYRNTTKKIPEIAKELGVANILEGGIQRSGNQVRINVQLIDAITDEHLWAETYDRKLTAENLFAIQSEISEAIAHALEAALSPEEQQRINTVPTENLAAYDAYLRGRQLMASRDSVKLEQATVEFRKAVELDPQFALAWVGVADSNSLLSDYGTLSNEVAVRVSEDAIDRALAIDDKLGEAYASLGVFYHGKNQLDKAEIAYEQAILLTPNYATAWHWYALLVSGFPLRSDEAIQLAQNAYELDPKSSIIGTMLGAAYKTRGLYSMAERQYQKVVELDPEFSEAFRTLARLDAWSLGRFDKAVDNARKANRLDYGNIGGLGLLALVFLELEDRPAYEAILEEMRSLDADHLTTALATVFVSTRQDNLAGTREAANRALSKSSNWPDFAMMIANIELTLGDATRVRDIYLDLHPGWLQPDKWQALIGRYPRNACIVSWLLINTGDEPLGTRLLTQATTYLDEALPAAVEHADVYSPELCYLTAGDTEKALASLETQLAHNHLAGWTVNHRMPMYEPIREDPRYLAMVAERERRIAVQREAVAQMELQTGQ